MHRVCHVEIRSVGRSAIDADHCRHCAAATCCCAGSSDACIHCPPVIAATPQLMVRQQCSSSRAAAVAAAATAQEQHKLDMNEDISTCLCCSLGPCDANARAS